jgi:hypothetical protein
VTSLDQLNDDFKDLLLAFSSEQVEFLIVGAYALAFHGLPRATGDIDVWVNPTPENAARVHHALRAFGAPLDAAGLVEADWTNPDLVYQIGVPPRRIDVLTGVSGIGFDAAWATRESARLSGHLVGFLGREALIQNKRAAGRLKDLADIENLDRQE